MLHVLVPLVATGFHIGKSPWGLLVLLAVGALTYYFVVRRRNRARDRDDRDERDPD